MAEDKKEEPKKEEPKQDHSKEMEALKARNAELDKKIQELTSKKESDDEDLLVKAKTSREAKDKKNVDTKALERAIMFNVKSKEFLEKNQSLLPKDVADIFALADKETYNDAIEKDSAIKTGIVQSFFSIQSNVDLLTGSQKSSLDEYLKLTKTGKQERAQIIYDSLFEPTFEMLKRIKKAEALSKGQVHEGDAEQAYKNKLIAGSKKHFGIGS